MALYLGNDKIKINLNGIIYNIAFTSAIRLLSVDNYVLKDSNGIYLVPKINSNIDLSDVLSTSDGYLLEELNGMLLAFKEVD